jgi:hypothetical protein
MFQQQGELARALMAAKKAALCHPEYKPWQRQVADLELLVAAARRS